MRIVAAVQGTQTITGLIKPENHESLPNRFNVTHWVCINPPPGYECTSWRTCKKPKNG